MRASSVVSLFAFRWRSAPLRISYSLRAATTVEEVNAVFTEEAGSDRYRGVLGVTDEPLVSSDFIQDTRASIVDLALTQVVDGDLVKVLSWYDNEWGYTSQMIREAVRIANATKAAAAR